MTDKTASQRQVEYQHRRRARDMRLTLWLPIGLCERIDAIRAEHPHNVPRSLWIENALAEAVNLINGKE